MKSATKRGSVGILLLLLLLLLGASAASAASPERAGLGPWTVYRIKMAVAAAGAGLLLWGEWQRREGRAGSRRRLRDALLLGLGLLAAACWFNLGRFHFGAGWQGLPYAHPHDTFHYYIGSKYFDELGFTRLYECTAVADVEAGLRERVRARPQRDLVTNRIVKPAAALADPGLCTRHFTPERWTAFTRDIAWFRERAPNWDSYLLDWGYNPTPVWGLVGGTLANTGPATQRQIGLLTLLDVPILLVMWGCVAWAFGWRVSCVGLIFWGTNAFARYAWTGGAFLRSGWLAATVIGVCLLRRGAHLGAGAFLAYATLVRVFPGLLPFAIGASALARMARERKPVLSPAHRRFALGGLLVAALLVPATLVAGGGTEAWSGFFRNARVDLQPTANQMGLRGLVSYRPEARLRQLKGVSNEAWSRARQAAFESRRPLYLAAAAALLGLAALAARRQPDWVVAVLAVGALPVFFDLASYYYAVLLVFAALWPRSGWVGVALCGLAAVSWGIATLSRSPDAMYTAMGLAVLLFTGFSSAALLAERRAAGAPAD